MKKNVVFSTISIDHDVVTACGTRIRQWRPLIELLQIKKFVIHKLIFFMPPSLKEYLPKFQEDLQEVAPMTQIVPILIDTKSNFSPHSFAENYLFFDGFFSSFPIASEEENYFLHFGPGNMFAHSFMIMMLVNFRKIPCRIIQLRSTKDKFGKVHSHIQLYDNAINNWISKMGGLEQSRELSHGSGIGAIRTTNEKYNEIVRNIEHVAAHSTAPILLSGETGTGKTQMARRIYEIRLKNGNVAGPLIEVNCASLRGDTAMSALFGHVRGSFTGATSERRGMLAMADGGILFLDEVGELSLDIQALLLKAIEEKRFFPFGSDKPVHSDFQLITATNQDLHKLSREGRFRVDLVSRINLWHFDLLPLRERREDIEPNIEFELKRLSEQRGIFADFLPEARKAYLNFAYSPRALWPGNFRSLASSMERMHTYSIHGIIDMKNVEREIEHLEYLWGRRYEWIQGMEFPHVTRVQERIGRELDLFEKVQLEKVLEICLSCDQRSEAGRKLFAVSRLKKTSVDDTARLNKYLKSFNLTWDDLQRK